MQEVYPAALDGFAFLELFDLSIFLLELLSVDSLQLFLLGLEQVCRNHTLLLSAGLRLAQDDRVADRLVQRMAERLGYWLLEPFMVASLGHAFLLLVLDDLVQPSRAAHGIEISEGDCWERGSVPFGFTVHAAMGSPAGILIGVAADGPFSVAGTVVPVLVGLEAESAALGLIDHLRHEPLNLIVNLVIFVAIGTLSGSHDIVVVYIHVYDDLEYSGQRPILLFGFSQECEVEWVAGGTTPHQHFHNAVHYFMARLIARLVLVVQVRYRSSYITTWLTLETLMKDSVESF